MNGVKRKEIRHIKTSQERSFAQGEKARVDHFARMNPFKEPKGEIGATVETTVESWQITLTAL